MVIKQIKKETAAYGRCNIDGRAFVILDDCLYDNSWARDKLMRSSVHEWSTLENNVSYNNAIPFRSSTQFKNKYRLYFYSTRTLYCNNRKRIYENYAGMFPTFESFCQVMDQCTENYECLVISNNAKSNKLDDQIFWYKADAHRDFKLGSKEFWEMSKDMGSDDDEETFDPKAQTKGPRINVKKSRW